MESVYACLIQSSPPTFLSPVGSLDRRDVHDIRPIEARSGWSIRSSVFGDGHLIAAIKRAIVG